mmetsp:Transcript_27636/g.89250  ORF Transcript_27636/g.89250 Transcript_27636/m.89250 type:complete len:222 (+) Transcript_27636:734-1399(+)
MALLSVLLDSLIIECHFALQATVILLGRLVDLLELVRLPYLQPQLLCHSAILEENLLCGGVQPLDRLLLRCLLHFRQHLLVLLLQPSLLLEKLPLHDCHGFLVRVLLVEQGLILGDHVGIVLHLIVLVVDELGKLRLRHLCSPHRDLQARAQLAFRCRHRGFLLCHLLSPLLGEQIALLLYCPLHGLNEFVLAFGISSQEGYDLQRIHLPLVLLGFEPLIL